MCVRIDSGGPLAKECANKSLEHMQIINHTELLTKIMGEEKATPISATVGAADIKEKHRNSGNPANRGGAPHFANGDSWGILNTNVLRARLATVRCLPSF